MFESIEEETQYQQWLDEVEVAHRAREAEQDAIAERRCAGAGCTERQLAEVGA